MRIIADIPHTTYKITLMHWNERYFIKFEYVGTELIFKFREGPLMENEEDLLAFMDEAFMQDVDRIYLDILESRQNAIDRQEKRIYGP